MVTGNNINKQVVINALGFNDNMDVYPKNMEYDGNTYDFVDRGLRTTIKRGDKEIAQIFSMSDGNHNYNLKNSTDSCLWTLLSIS